MSRQTISILFLARTSKMQKTGEVALQMRVTINGQRKDIYLPRKIVPKYWDQKKEKATGKDPISAEINKYISSCKARIYEILRKLEDDGIPANVGLVKDMFSGKESKVSKCHMFCEEFEAEIKRMESLIDIEIEKITVGRYKLCLKYFKEMYARESRQPDLPLKDVSNAMIKRLDTFLKVDKELSQNTVIRYMKCFKKIINIGLNNGWITRNPFFGIKQKETPVHKDTLTVNEITRIYEKEFETEALNRCRDVFVFQCFTGLAFIDVHDLYKEHIFEDDKGNKWIRKARQKTDIEAFIPLLETPLAILKKYEQHPRCIKTGRLLPVDVNQRLNSCLKEIAAICGINKKLTTHTARHTFATLLVAHHAALKNVAKLMGHASTRMTERYAQPQVESLMNDMQEMNSMFASRV